LEINQGSVWTVDPEGGGSTGLRNVVRYLSVDTANAKKEWVNR